MAKFLHLGAGDSGNSLIGDFGASHHHITSSSNRPSRINQTASDRSFTCHRTEAFGCDRIELSKTGAIETTQRLTNPDWIWASFSRIAFAL